MDVPQGSGGGKVDTGRIHDGNREGLSGNYELHEQHVGFYLSAIVTLAQENGYWAFHATRAHVSVKTNADKPSRFPS